MLSSENRLRKKSDINKVFRGGKTIAGRLILIRVARNESKNNRFTTVVSLKVSKKAVKRNKIKRQIREIIKGIELAPGFDFVVIAKPQICERSFQEIKQDLNEIFNFEFNKAVSKKCF